MGQIPKNFDDFRTSMKLESPPLEWPESLRALWWDAHGNWKNSHDIAQEIHSNTGYWIHAYLHRKEGDEWNAGYWYRRAGRAFPVNTLKEEFKDLVLSILEVRR